MPASAVPLDHLHLVGSVSPPLPARRAVIEALLGELSDDDCVISALGYISRDLFAASHGCRERCFYCMGSMGSVIPLSLGVSLARPSVRVVAFEGDGSCLMNLGALVTVARYRPHNLSIVLFDNRRYESSGGQVSQPDGLRIEDLSAACGLSTRIAESTVEVVSSFREMRREPAGSPVLVAKVALGAPALRIGEAPELISRRFADWLRRQPGAAPVPS